MRSHRVLPRIDLPFKMVVRGVDTTGTRFQESCSIENISAGGLYVRLERTLQPGAFCFTPQKGAVGRFEAKQPKVAVSECLHFENRPSIGLKICLRTAFSHR
jgi:hypothetical protein